MVDGFLVIDKPAGITSHDVVNRVRRILGIRKIGHTGTLDPFATGVLPIAVCEGTKAIPFLDEGEKGYDASICLGVSTDTLDHTGKVLSRSDCSFVTPEAFVEAVKKFSGQISQLPPMFSAIKQDGQPLYKLARKGIDVERKSRQVTIYSIEILKFDMPHVEIRVKCSRGTYIRSLSDDIGQYLGCGATLSGLRRTSSGLFRIEDAVTLSELESLKLNGDIARILLPPFEMLTHLDMVMVSQEEALRIKNGQTAVLESIASRLQELPEGKFCRIICETGPVAVGCFINGGIVLKRVFCCR